ncbi:hypothetical protein GMA12_02960 [Kocuria sediminis]|uniref:Uncharacterized protein n=1 Tax=Kocuria sediminis TaxID=1038857 RepID=A0A6N8GLI2_9MICC|nr:hypothetical protein [Kocuria sediminis]MUN62113.1 hypothetical protein [Kocuria sediminis]
MDFAGAAMLVCALGWNALFKWGYIFANLTGRVRCGRPAETADLQGGVDLLIGKACAAHNAVTKGNFEVHRTLVEGHRND